MEFNSKVEYWVWKNSENAPYRGYYAIDGDACFNYPINDIRALIENRYLIKKEKGRFDVNVAINFAYTIFNKCFDVKDCDFCYDFGLYNNCEYNNRVIIERNKFKKIFDISNSHFNNDNIIPVSISYNEFYSSLQTGIVDGADNPLTGILNMCFYEVGSYVLDMPHQYEASVIIINSDFFNSLSEEDQAVINEAMEEGAEYFKQISDEALEGYRSQLEEKGMEFVTPDDPQEWKDAAQTIYSEFTEGNEDLLQEIIDCQK